MKDFRLPFNQLLVELRPLTNGVVIPVLASAMLFFLYSEAGSHLVSPRSAAAIAQIIIDPSNPTSTEITVNEGNSIQLKPRVIDSAGNIVDNAPLTFSSVSPDIATVDGAGNVQGRKAGFSTMAVSSGGVVAVSVITVAKIISGAAGFEITGLTQDLGRRLYLADTRDHTILLADDLQQMPAIYAGIDQTSGLVDGDRLKSLFKNPAFVAFNEAEGSLYVSDSRNNVIRRVRPGPVGRVETLVLSGAALDNPQGLALDDHGTLWVADSGSHTIKRIDLAAKTVSTIAGQPGSSGLMDGAGVQARFNSPTGIAIETESLAKQLEREAISAAPPPVSVIIADTGNGLIRRVKETGQVETIGTTATKVATSSLLYAWSTFPLSPSPAPSTPLIAVAFSAPTGIAVDPLGNIYVTEAGSGQVKIVLQNGTIVPATQSNTFTAPRGITVGGGRVVVAEGNRLGQQITYGEPSITEVAPAQISNRGSAKITVKGLNFAPDSLVIVAGVVIRGIQISDTKTISFTTPPLPSGRTTVTVQNRGGLTQGALVIEPASLSELPPGYITTVVGGSTFSGDGASALSAALNLPTAITLDSAGNLYVADTDNQRIRRVDSRTGIITAIAGTGEARFSGDNGPATAATLRFPQGLAIDSSGNLYIADTTNQRIRRVDSATRIITTVAGGGSSQQDNLPATSAALLFPSGIAIDSSGSLYIADRDSYKVRKVDTRTGIITTAAGSGQKGFSGDGGPATQAALNLPLGVALDASGNLYIADRDNNRIRKVDSRSGIITTLASAGVSQPGSLAVDSSGNLYIAAVNRVLKVDNQTRIVTTVAGSAAVGFSGDGGPAIAAGLDGPRGIVIDSLGNVYIADSFSQRIRKVEAKSGVIKTIVGSGQEGPTVDNVPATAAALSNPQALAIDFVGNLYVADSSNYRVRKVDGQTGIITTVAGTGRQGFSGDGGPATAATLQFLGGLAADLSGNLYIADTQSNRIRRVSLQTGIIETAAGGGSTLGDNGPATAAALNSPQGLVTDPLGNLYIADTDNHRIRKMEGRTSVITTVAGNGQEGFSGDNGPATAARLGLPEGLAIDSLGNVYIADSSNNRIRRVDARSAIITTIAGTGEAGFSGDNGPASLATLRNPRDLAFDSSANLFIADSWNGRIRRVDGQTGIIKTVAGTTGLATLLGDNGRATEAFLIPVSVEIDRVGNIFFADAFGARIRGIRGAPLRRRP